MGKNSSAAPSLLLGQSLYSSKRHLILAYLSGLTSYPLFPPLHSNWTEAELGILAVAVLVPYTYSHLILTNLLYNLYICMTLPLYAETPHQAFYMDYII